MITIQANGKYRNTRRFLERSEKMDIHSVLVKYAKQGAYELAKATPVDTGKTAESWGYEVITSAYKASIVWTNRNIVNGVPIAVILQYGHGTGNGGYVQGRDYINPALRPVFDKLAEDAWREVTK